MYPNRITALNTLIHDHRRINDLFENLQQADDSLERRILFQDLKNHLKAHTALEEDILYPQLEKFAELADFLEGSYDEHREMKEIIAEIDNIEIEAKEMDPLHVDELRDELESAIEELIDIVSYHVEEEEEKLFPQILELMSVPELDRLEDALTSEVANRQGLSQPGEAA